MSNFLHFGNFWDFYNLKLEIYLKIVDFFKNDKNTKFIKLFDTPVFSKLNLFKNSKTEIYWYKCFSRVLTDMNTLWENKKLVQSAIRVRRLRCSVWTLKKCWKKGGGVLTWSLKITKSLKSTTKKPELLKMGLRNLFHHTVTDLRFPQRAKDKFLQILSHTGSSYLPRE